MYIANFESVLYENGGRVTVYIPTLTAKEQGNTVSLFAGDVDITVYEAEIVTLKERF